MKLVTKPNQEIAKKKKKPRLKNRYGKVERKHPKFGTSKLEKKFAKEFLDKLGVNYVWQFEAKEIGRFYDFFLPDYGIITEIDGSYFHNDPRVVSQDKIKPMHKKNMRVDEEKNKWADIHHYRLLRFWEKDINENPTRVLKELKEALKEEGEKVKLIEEKNKRHVNKIRRLEN